MAIKKKTERTKRYTAHPARDPKRRMQTVKRVLISVAILLVVVVTVLFLVLRVFDLHASGRFSGIAVRGIGRKGKCRHAEHDGK